MDVRRLGAVPSLVSLLDSGRRPVHISACGALRNLAFGREPENKIAIARCNGIQELVRLLRRTQDVDVIDMVTGTISHYKLPCTHESESPGPVALTSRWKAKIRVIV